MTVLGDRVLSPVCLVRRRTYRGGSADRKTWAPVKAPVAGIFIGCRTYANGELGGGYAHDDPLYFIPKEYIKIALIVVDVHTNPIPVPLEEMVAAPTMCPDCGQEIDPETCYCGDPIGGRAYHDGHSPVPMGCACGYAQDGDGKLE